MLFFLNGMRGYAAFLFYRIMNSRKAATKKAKKKSEKRKWGGLGLVFSGNLFISFRWFVWLFHVRGRLKSSLSLLWEGEKTNVGDCMAIHREGEGSAGIILFFTHLTMPFCFDELCGENRSRGEEQKAFVEKRDLCAFSREDCMRPAIGGIGCRDMQALYVPFSC